MKKLISIILTLAMILSMVAVLTVSTSAAWDGTTVSTGLNGTGTEADPYLIETAADLAYLAQTVNAGTAPAGAYYKLVNDIDLGGNEWTPIGKELTTKASGTWTAAWFNGNFDGAGKTVKNFKITTSAYAAGLFGIASGTISNLTVDNAQINIGEGGAIAVGLIVGSVFGEQGSSLTIKNCQTTESCSINVDAVKETGDSRAYKVSWIGGLIGGQEYTTYGIALTVENCVNRADVVTALNGIGSTNTGTGGLIGLSRELTANNCINFGDVTITYTGKTTAFAAGIIGRLMGPTTNVTSAISYGNIKGHNRTGGMVGAMGNTAGNVHTFTDIYLLAETIAVYDPVAYPDGKAGSIIGAVPGKPDCSNSKNIYVVPVEGLLSSGAGTELSHEVKTKEEIEAMPGYQAILAACGLNEPECEHTYGNVVLADGSNAAEEGACYKVCTQCGELSTETFTPVENAPAFKDENGNAVDFIIEAVDTEADEYKVAVSGYENNVIAALNVVDAKGATTITFAADGIADGNLIYLISYDANGIVATAKAVVENGSVTFASVPTGSFVVVDTGISPSTGDNVLAYVIALVAVITLAGATVVVAKKRAIAE